jgi:hypothetical protein
MKMVVLYLAIASIIALLSFLGISSYYFNRMIHQETEHLISPQQKDSLELFDYGDLMKLPAPVRRYLRQAVPDGYPIIRTAELKYNGHFRTGPDKEWWPIEGKEFFKTNHPAYLWIGNITPKPMVRLKARDKYVDGQGEILVRLYSSLTVTKMRNPKVSQSALIRFAGEMPWFPTAFVDGDYLRWEPIDNQSARAIITDNDMEVAVTYYFNENNEIVRFFTQDRYLDEHKQGYTGYYNNYQEMNGIRIPTEVEAQWNLPEGNFSYARFSLGSIVYNKFETRSNIQPHPVALQ